MVSIDNVLSHFKPLNHVVLASVDKDKPRLRPMTVVWHEEEFYFATGEDANKVRQLEENQEVEFILQWKDESNNGYIRVEGSVVKIDSIDNIAKLYSRFDYFSKLWKGPEDPTLVVYRVMPKMYDYMKPGEWASVQIKARR